MKELQKKIDSQIALVKAIKSNDSNALKSLYTSNFYKVELMVIKNSGSREHAKDIYQEAFITLWKNVKNNSFVPHNETALQGYLYQIAKNKNIDLFIHDKGKIKMIFEVKRSSSSQHLFAGVGQLLIYSMPVKNKVDLILVLPDKLKQTIENRLEKLGIRVLYYDYNDGKPIFHKLEVFI